MLTLSELLERQAHRRPKATVLSLKNHHTTYGELQSQVEKWASVLHSRGIRAGDPYGIILRNSPEFVITFFALARLGARAVPVNFLLKPDEIAYIFADAGVVGVVTQPSFLPNVLVAQKQLPGLRDVVVTGEGGEGGVSFNQLQEAVKPVQDLPKNTDPNAIAMIIYTSGTTGKPKGAMLSHRNFLVNVEQCAGMVRLYQKDVFLCLLPMFHSFAWTVCVLLPISLGCCIVVVESIQPFGNTVKRILRHRVTILVAVPPIYAALLRVPFWRPLKIILPLRLCISGAAPLPMTVHQKFEAKFGIPLLEGYGLTETSPVVTINPEDQRFPGSVGRPLPGVEIHIVDERGQTVPAGEVGEICVRGENVMKGYYHQDEATREAFLDDAHQWLRTGDVGYLDSSGYLYISDRKKDLIIVKGLNVYPKEVEDLLLTHPAVQEAAVVGFRHGTGDEWIKAFVTLKDGGPVDKHVLLKYCRSKLASYKCPRDLEIRPELPKNTLGKVLKRALRAENP